MSLSIALVHFPVRDRLGRVVNTSITNLDIHDLARAGRTFGVARYYLVAPVESQRWFAQRVIDHWSGGAAAEMNITRKEALELVRIVRDINEIAVDLERDPPVAPARTEDGGAAEEVDGAFPPHPHDPRPIFVATSAKPLPNTIGYEAFRARLETEPATSFCLLFGTGYGLDPEVLSEVDLMLPPILGPVAWNHLPVRSAASIILDRLCGNR